MWDIKKLYTSNEFNDDETSLGYKIDVYQESINKTFSEYLVNFDFLAQSLETYGFVPAPVNEVKQMGFTKSVGSFRDLSINMQEEIERKQINKTTNNDKIKRDPDSPFAVLVAFVHLYTLFMIVPIFNSMMRMKLPTQIVEQLNQILEIIKVQ